MPAAALQLGSARASARRIGAVLDTPDPVADPPAARPLPPGPCTSSVGVQVRTSRAARSRWTGSTSTCRRDGGRAHRPERRGQVDGGRRAAALP